MLNRTAFFVMRYVVNSLRALLMAAALLMSLPARGSRIYFTDQPATGAGSVMSIAPDGTDQRTVTTVSGGNLRGIAFHRGGGRIYFLDNGTARKIYSILPDGSGQQDAVTLPGTFNSDVEIDEDAQKLYWSDNTANGSVMRANLNGTSVEAVVTPGIFGMEPYTAPYFLFVDSAAGYVYWGVASEGNTSSNFRRATLAGGVIDPNFVIMSPTRSRDIAIDPVSNTAFFCDRQMGTIYRRALSGGLNQIVLSGLNAPHGIALDHEAEKVYWADTGARGSGPFDTSARRVARCNFDGSEYENLSTPAINSEAWDLALDLTSTNYNEWRPRFFSTSTPAAGLMDDADGDGAVNLLEYAMGTH